MKILLSTAFALLVTVFAAHAATVHMSDFGNGSDTADDTIAFQKAIDTLKTEGGGTLIVDDGVWYVSDTLNLTAYQNYVSYKIQGTKGAVIEYSSQNPNNNGFYIGNVNQAEFRDLIFRGKEGVHYDVRYLIGALYTASLRVTACQFYGIRAREAIIYGGNVDVRVSDSLFHGAGGDKAVVLGGASIETLIVDNSQFYDYGNFRDKYYSKIGGLSWISAERTDPSPINAHQPYVSITKSRFDEGALVGVSVKNIDDVRVANCYFNVSNVLNGAGIVFDNVGHGVIEASGFGYAGSPHPAVKLLNNTNSRISRLKFSAGVYFADWDETSAMRIEYCPECTEPKRISK